MPHSIAGIALIAVTLLASARSEAIDLLRFPICWAGVLLALSGTRQRLGSSPLPTLRDWVACAAASVLFWDIFELVNLRLKNWWYTGVSPDPIVAGAFGALSFATVLPAARLLVGRGPWPPAERRGLRLAAGLAMLGLALAFPRWAFPLAWIFLWPIGEAIAGVRIPVRLALFGPLLGFLWESLNWGCRRGWVYTVPHFEAPKLFEMPLAGYLGYLPFVLEAAAALAVVDRVLPRLRGVRGALAVAAVIATHFAVDDLARPTTDVSFAPYDTAGVPRAVLDLERRTHMGLPRAQAVAERGWSALAEDDPALVRVWMKKAMSR